MNTEEKMRLADDLRRQINILLTELDRPSGWSKELEIRKGLLKRLREALIDLNCDLSQHTHHQSNPNIP